MKTYIGICMLVIMTSFLIPMYIKPSLMKWFKVKNERKYDMFVRWMPVVLFLIMVATFFTFANYKKVPEVVVPVQDSAKIWGNDKDTLAVDSLNKK